MSNEQILVFPSEELAALGAFDGFSTDMKYRALIDGSVALEYKDKPAMEIDPAYKQIIPYMVFIALPAGERPLILSYLRGKGGGESRLHGKLSAGIGGHMNSGDKDYASAFSRELQEEICLEGLPLFADIVGFVNDDSTEVGKVHFGVVHLFIYASDVNGYSPEADALRELAWRDWETVRESNMEAWTDFCLPSVLDMAIAIRKNFGR